MYGNWEYAWILKFVPVSLAAFRSLPKTPFVFAVLLMFFSSFFMLALRFVSFRMFSCLLGGLCLICGHVRKPPIGGSASSNVISSVCSSSTTVLAALSTVTLYSKSMCDFTFPMRVLSYLWYLSLSCW